MDVRIVKIRGEKYIEPFDTKDQALFYHCAGRIDFITPDEFRDRVFPLLVIHGKKCINYR